MLAGQFTTAVILLSLPAALQFIVWYLGDRRLVGMLLVGILAGPSVLGLLSPEIMEVSGDFRKIALIVILLRAGFELHRDTLNRVGRAALIMSTLPAVFEIIAVEDLAPSGAHGSLL